jgi:hypothetical protein
MALWKSVVCLICLSLGIASELLARPGRGEEEIPNWTIPGFAALAAAQAMDESDVPEVESLRSAQEKATLTAPSSFVGITPCRIVDTRGNGFGGSYGPPSLAAGLPRDFILPGRCDIPANALAVSLNLTVVLPTGSGYLATFPKGGVVPLVSSVNFGAGQVIANAAIVPLGTGGAITAFTAGAGADLLIDTNGYFVGPPSSGAASFKVFGVSNIQCAQVAARLDALTGNASSFTVIGSAEVMIANDGSWFYSAVNGDCSPLTNAPARAHAMVPIDRQGAIVRGYWTLETLP